MSIRSYKKNVERGVTGPEIGVCLPASLEQISPNHYYRPNIYTRYEQFMDYLETLNTSQLSSKEVCEEYEDVIENLLRPMGKKAFDQMIMRQINTERGFVSIVRKLHSEDFRVVVDIQYGNRNPNKEVHSVGLIPVDVDYVTLVSTHVPVALRGIISTEHLFNHLAQITDSKIKGHPIATANVMAIPHE
jgi:hypothetical protein